MRNLNRKKSCNNEASLKGYVEGLPTSGSDRNLGIHLTGSIIASAKQKDRGRSCITPASFENQPSTNINYKLILPFQIYQFLQQFIGCGNDPRIGLERALGCDHVDELSCKVHIAQFERI